MKKNYRIPFIIALKNKYLEINQEGERFAQWKLQNTVEDKWKHYMDSKP